MVVWHTRYKSWYCAPFQCSKDVWHFPLTHCLYLKYMSNMSSISLESVPEFGVSLCSTLKKKWRQKGASEEPFRKTAPFCKEGPFFCKKKGQKRFCWQKRCRWGAVLAPLFFSECIYHNQQCPSSLHTHIHLKKCIDITKSSKGSWWQLKDPLKLMGQKTMKKTWRGHWWDNLYCYWQHGNLYMPKMWFVPHTNFGRFIVYINMIKDQGYIMSYLLLYLN